MATEVGKVPIREKVDHPQVQLGQLGILLPLAVGDQIGFAVRQLGLGQFALRQLRHIGQRQGVEADAYPVDAVLGNPAGIDLGVQAVPGIVGGDQDQPVLVVAH